jgi:hypothetical protein
LTEVASNIDIEVVRINRLGTELWVVFRDRRFPRVPNAARGERNADNLVGWHYDVSTGNYESEYPGDPREFASELVVVSMTESDRMHPAGAGEISWKALPGMEPGPLTLADYDRAWESQQHSDASTTRPDPASAALDVEDTSQNRNQ